MTNKHTSLADRLGKLSPEKQSYLLQNLPQHFDGAEQKDELIALLTDLGFLETKIYAFNAQLLILGLSPEVNPY